MREIQFRAKRMDTGEWVQSGNLLLFNEGNEIFILARDSHVVAEVDEKIIINFKKACPACDDACPFLSLDYADITADDKVAVRQYYCTHGGLCEHLYKRMREAEPWPCT